MYETPDSTRPKTRLWGVIAVLAMAASIVFIAPASASHAEGELPMFVEHVNTKANGTEVYRAPMSRVYDNLTGETMEYVVIWNGDIYDVCGVRDPSAIAPPAKKFLAKQKGNGKWTVKTPPGGHVAYTSVYKTELPVIPDFFNAACNGFFGEGKPLPAPFATGVATVMEKVTRLADPLEQFDGSTPPPRGKHYNAVTGEVADANGVVYDLEAVADYIVRDPMAPMPEFNQLTVTLTPKAA